MKLLVVSIKWLKMVVKWLWRNIEELLLYHYNDPEKIWKNEFDFWILHIKKLGYVAIFMKIPRKTFDPFKAFLTNQDKNEDEDEKIWKNEFDFWILHIKLCCMKLFIKIWQRSFLSKFLPEKDTLGQRCRPSLPW